MSECNICGEKHLLDFRSRKNVLCNKCKSLERHRLVKYTLELLGWLDPNDKRDKRVFHLAPEACTSSYMSKIFGVGYITSDYNPKKYPHAQCLKLKMPENFEIFPDDYFDLILHNHVLEHIPGDYHAHMEQFHRILKPGGQMIFTIPLCSSRKTCQGGELMNSDDERLAAFGQKDHYKIFGQDFLNVFKTLKCKFEFMHIPEDVRTKLNGYDPIYVYTKL